MRLLRLLLPAVVLLLPIAAYADYSLVNSAVDSVGGSLPFFQSSSICSAGAACGFVEIASGVVDRFRPLLTIIGALVIVIYGYRMIVGQEDDVITKARAVMSGTIAGLIMAYLIDPFIAAFYGSTGEVAQGGMAGGVAVLSTELSGIINWALTVVAVLAILMIILTTVKAVGTSTGEEGIANIRKSIFSVVFGLLLLMFRLILSQGFVESTNNPVPILASTLSIIAYLMGFIGMIAVVVVLYAGFQYVLSMGKEEQATQAKGLLGRAALGAVVILMSLALVQFVLKPMVS